MVQRKHGVQRTNTQTSGNTVCSVECALFQDLGLVFSLNVVVVGGGETIGDKKVTVRRDKLRWNKFCDRGDHMGRKVSVLHICRISC